MTFLAPAMLAGAAAVSIPLALHFFYKARHRPVPWAAMKFLKLSIEQTSRRLKFQEWILLVLRCLALLLLAFALARPSLFSAGGGGRGEGVDAIFVFDTSYSMGARDGEMTRIERAKQAAKSIVDQLPPNSTVQMFASLGVERVAPIRCKPTDFNQVKTAIDEIRVGNQAGDMLPGLIEAEKALVRAAGQNKEVYLFTDMQKSGWDRQTAAVRTAAEEIRRQAALLIVRCGNPERALSNVAIVDIVYPDGIPISNNRMEVTVLVKNTGSSVVRNVPLTLEVDNDEQSVETAIIRELQAGQATPVAMTIKLRDQGLRLLTAKLGTPAAAAAPGTRKPDAETTTAGSPASVAQPDDLPGDNRFDKLIRVREKVRVLLVDGNPDATGSDSKDSGSHYLRNALQPVPESDRAAYFVKVKVVTANDAAPADLSDSDLCVLVNVPASSEDKNGIPGLSKEFVDRLPSFVKDGGGLLISAGDFIVPTRYNQILGTGGHNLLPFDLTDVSTTTPDKPFSPAPDSVAPSFLSNIRKDPFSRSTALVEVLSVMGVNEAKGGGSILLGLNTLRPLICSKTVGSGEVIFMNTTLDARWTDWCARPGSYLSLIRWTLAHLTGTSANAGNIVAGQTIRFTAAEDARAYELEKPDHTRVSLGRPTGGGNGDKLSVSSSDTSAAGEYRIGFEGETPLAAARFAAVPDLRESESLVNLSDREVADALGFQPIIVTSGSDTDNIVGAERARREWTIWALLILFIIASGEGVWAWFCGKAW